MLDMTKVGIRELKQNASAVVAAAASGEIVIASDRGRPTAQMGPLLAGRVESLITGGRARPARRNVSDLPARRNAVEGAIR